MKELIVILAIAGLTFRLAKPIALRFSADADFLRRRNVWFALTIIAFLSPNFWIFALFAVPIYIWMGRKDSNPIAAYLLLMHVVPPVSANLPAIGASQLFSLDNYRLLAFCVLIPTALRARRSLYRDRTSRSRMTDLLLLAFVVVHSATFVPPDLPNHVILHDSLTNLLRRVFLDFVDIFVLYYAVSRSCNDQRKMIDAEAALCLSGGTMAVIATFEHLKGWLLYTQLAAHWDPTDAYYQLAWLLRGDSWLRAQASSGHALSLGVILAIAFGFWLYLQSRATTLRARVTFGIVFWLGMVATYSRGPWIGAVLIYFAYSALKPRAISRLFKAGFLMAIVLGLATLSPTGERMMTSLHVTGGQPDADFLYRQRLLDRSLELVQAHPLFGDPLAVQEMEALRQGQGIIDIVNTYVGVLLFHGWVGLALFLGFILSGLWGAFKTAKAAISTDVDWALLGFNISACIIGILFMIADCSLIFAVEKMLYILVALAAAYARQGNQAASHVSTTNADRRSELRSLNGARAMPFAD
jgi:hypothetical protein